MNYYASIFCMAILSLVPHSYVHANPLQLQLTNQEALQEVQDFVSQLKQLQAQAQSQGHEDAHHHRHHQHHRSRRQSEGGFGEMFSGLGGRLTGLRDSWRETVRPIQEQLNPMPMVENFGKMLAEASSNTMTRGREAVQGIRDFGSRTTSRLREGVSDAWEGLRDNWEEFWDL